jgi:hypothetical protein
VRRFTAARRYVDRVIDGGDGRHQVSEGRLDGGGGRESLLVRVREPVDRRHRLDLFARLTAVAAGLAVLGALPLTLYTAAFGSRMALGIHVTGWGQVTTFGIHDAFATDYRAPAYGYVLATAAVFVVLTAWTIPRGATLGLGVLVGCTAVLFADVRNLGEQPGAHVTTGPVLPVVAIAVSLALLARLATRLRRPPVSTPPG